MEQFFNQTEKISLCWNKSLENKKGFESELVIKIVYSFYVKRLYLNVTRLIIKQQTFFSVLSDLLSTCTIEVSVYLSLRNSSQFVMPSLNVHPKLGLFPLHHHTPALASLCRCKCRLQRDLRNGRVFSNARMFNTKTVHIQCKNS